MKDEKRKCVRCGHDHNWGILRYSADNVPLYGARWCTAEITKQGPTFGDICKCKAFVEADPNVANLPALSEGEIKELWADTAFLNAQVPTAVRVMIRKIMAIGKGDDKAVGFWGRHFGSSKTPTNIMEKQWPEFMGLMISQITDIRGAMVRNDSKFAHLVAHTDDLVESMRGVVQLSERLSGVNRRVDDVNERLDRIEGMLRELTGDSETKCTCAGEIELSVIGQCPIHGSSLNAAARRIFQSGNNAPLRDEAIVTDGTSVDSDKTE